MAMPLIGFPVATANTVKHLLVLVDDLLVVSVDVAHDCRLMSGIGRVMILIFKGLGASFSALGREMDHGIERGSEWLSAEKMILSLCKGSRRLLSMLSWVIQVLGLSSSVHWSQLGILVVVAVLITP